MTDRQFEPDGFTEHTRCARLARFGRRGGDGQFLGRGAALAPKLDEGGGHLFGPELRQNLVGHGHVVQLGRKGRMVQHPRIVTRPNLFRRGRLPPLGLDPRAFQQPHGLLVL